MNKKLIINNKVYIEEAFNKLNKMPRMNDSRTSLNESSHNYKMFTVDDEDSHVVVKDINGVVQSRADSVEEAHEQIENELCTCRASINLQNISEEDLHLLCNNSNISIVQEEPINILNCTFQGDRGNIRSLLDDLKNMRSVDNFEMLGESMHESEDGDDLQVFYRRDGKWVPKEDLKESNDEEVEIDTCAIRLDKRNISYKSVLSDIDKRIKDNELSVIKEKNNPNFVEYIIQGDKDSIYSFLHENRRRIMDYEYLPK